MKITRDVIVDLLPAYQSGEASADTKALIEEYLREDPQLARVVRQPELPVEKLAAEAPPDLMLRSLAKTKKLIRLRSWLLTLGILSTWASFFTLIWDLKLDGRPVRGTFFMWRDQPLWAAAAAAVAVCCWVAYYRIWRRLRTTLM
jgi:hypothetical protein